MKKKHIITIFLVLLIVSCGFLIWKSIRLDKAYRESRAAYEVARELAAGEQAAAEKRIGELTNSVGHMTNVISQLEHEVEVKTGKIVALQSDIADLQASEPATTPEIEAMPIVINLRAQVAKLTEAFTLAHDVIDKQAEEIRAWETKYDLQVEISNEWKCAYDREHDLRLQAEGLVVKCESRLKPWGWKNIRNMAIGAAAGFVAGAIVK